MSDPRVLATVVTDLVVPLPRSAVKLGQFAAGVQLAGPVAPVTASIANGTNWMSTAGLLSVVSTALEEQAMSTQPRPGSGAIALLAWVLAAFSASRSAAMPWPEPLGRAKLQSPADSGNVAVGLGTTPFCTAQPSCGVMASLIAPVAGLVALYD